MTKKLDEKWSITAERYVAFIDIMGFKDLVLHSSHDEIYTMMKKIDKSKKFVENIKWSGLEENLVKSTTYSDSIIIYSKDNSYDAFDALVTTVSGITHYLFKDGIPFKGAIAYGTMTLDTDNSIFFGQPLIDAYLLQEEVYFYGVLFHATVDNQLDSTNKKWPPFTSLHLCNLKNGVAKHITVYPMYANTKDDETKKERYQELIDGVKKLRLKTSGHIRKYIDNTENYLDSVSKNLKRNYN